MNIIQGSILDFDGDAIVNPANSFLRHGAGLAKVIANAAAPKGARGTTAWWREQFSHPLIPTGGVGVTSAGRLPYNGIIHAVGPIWGGGAYHEAELLASAYSLACHRAFQRGWKRIAFPAISCGIFGYPVEKAATVAITEASAWAHFDVECNFYLFGDEHFAAYQEAAGNKPLTAAPSSG